MTTVAGDGDGKDIVVVLRLALLREPEAVGEEEEAIEHFILISFGCGAVVLMMNED
jgi:hypothetical protein